MSETPNALAGPTVRRRVIFWACSAVVIGTLLVLLLPASTSDRGPQRYLACKNDLKTVEIALLNYHAENDSFPPAVTYGPDGKPWHSWRVLLLPYLDQPGLYREYRFAEPWDGPHNRLLVGRLPRSHYYLCNSDPGAENGETSYLAVIGDRTLWPPTGAATLGGIPDGAGRTIHVVESWQSGIVWTEPRDLSFEKMTFAVNAQAGEGIRGRHPGEDRLWGDGPPRANVAFADGSVKPVTTDTPPETVKSLLLRDDGGPKEWP